MERQLDLSSVTARLRGLQNNVKVASTHIENQVDTHSLPSKSMKDKVTIASTHIVSGIVEPRWVHTLEIPMELTYPSVGQLAEAPRMSKLRNSRRDSSLSERSEEMAIIFMPESMVKTYVPLVVGKIVDAAKTNTHLRRFSFNVALVSGT
ncbi:hypothetical protein Taro_037221 [Colocasia esculenta]|uniref:Uncharacterized protein n=1 Tax=Colocasia esculenta TaxID=4460 RepID=A0A843WK60_COLES|nr:hypothetical protein [Colocasia esculenta]